LNTPNYIISSTDEKTEKLTGKYKKIFGLDDKSKAKIRKLAQPLLIAEVRKRLDV